MIPDTDIASLARQAWGEPNSQQSTRDELRFGSHGSKSVNLKDRTWFDHEAVEGGGCADLYEKVYGQQPTDASIAATYDYCDEQGRLIYQVVRKVPKAFLQRRPNGNGGWVWNMRGQRRVPYRLPELLRSNLDTRVFIVEGEKDVDALRGRGVIATTNPGGAGKWLAEYGEYFKDRRVAILPDNDPQVINADGSPRYHSDGRPVLPGQDHATDIAGQLRNIAASIRVIMLPGLPEKGDASDWLDAGGTAEELERLVREAPEYQPTDGTSQSTADTFSEALLDPWADPPQPEWPAGILLPAIEDTIAQIALADGVDMGAQAMAFIAAASGAADKQSRLDAYLNGRFMVPPIIWAMVVADSGMRKTAILHTAFSALKRETGKRWSDYQLALKRYRHLPAEERRDEGEPTEPSSLIVDDITPEKLAELLGDDPRGMVMLKEELVGVFDFGRYSATSGAAARGFLLTTYDGNDTWFHRRSSGAMQISNAALTLFGCTQPTRLAKFKDLEDDGLLQRFLIMRPARALGGSRLDVHVRGLDRIETAITDLVHRSAMRYRLSPTGAAMVRETERLGADWERQAEAGLGFPAWARKMHGQHARLALILHLLEAPGEAQIADDVVMRAGRLLREYLLPHAYGFYSGMPDGGLELLRSTAGWLLTKAPTRFTAGNVQQGVSGCARKPLRFIQAALDPLVTGGWLEPETEYPNNRVWTLVHNVRQHFAERTKAERQRRAALAELIRGNR